MKEYSFLFDLDATITRVEILPRIAERIGKQEEMIELTERTMKGEVPFAESFMKRVEILGVIPVSRVSEIVRDIPVHEDLCAFIRAHKDRCYVVTGNLDIWIGGLMERLGIAPDHVFCSHAKVENDRITALTEICDKGKVLEDFPHPFVAVGDGNNDAGMVGAADIGIGFGAVREIAYSVLNNADYAIYTEKKLCFLLNEIAHREEADSSAAAREETGNDVEAGENKCSKTIVISCAGMGTRLGIGTTKALIDVDGKPLIIRQLELLKDFEDVRIVVGYQAERVIALVNDHRRDVLYVFNHNYKGTGTGASFKLGCRYAGDLVVALDGDLLVHPEDLRAVLESDKELVGGCTPSTDNPVLIHAEEDPEGRKIIGYFSRESGEYEWTGLAQIRRERLPEGTGHVYQLLEPLLPLEMIEIRTKEIDTMSDYEHAVNWVRNGYKD